jgi:L-iditol 2-dehydrogenase
MAAPGFAQKAEIAEDAGPLAAGFVRLRLIVAGLCGSDMPRFNGIVVRPWLGVDDSAPIHEIVGEVVESASEEFTPGQRVVGTAGGTIGGVTGTRSLTQYMTVAASRLIKAPEDFDDVDAVAIQSVSTVIRATRHFPDVADKRVAVLGAGPIGLSFLHVLKHRGAHHITAIDPVERTEIAQSYGADDFYHMRSSQWARCLSERDRPDIVVETVGHQHSTIYDAIEAVAEHGFVYGFGSPDDANYVIPYQSIYEKNITISAGRTLDAWQDVLEEGKSYMVKYRNDFQNYVSHVYDIDEAQAAYSAYARPQAGRLKVAIAVTGARLDRTR